MNWIHKLLDALVCKDMAPQLEVKDNEIKRQRDELKDMRQKMAYGVIVVIFLFFWALGATIAAVEIGIH